MLELMWFPFLLWCFTPTLLFSCVLWLKNVPYDPDCNFIVLVQLENHKWMDYSIILLRMQIVVLSLHQFRIIHIRIMMYLITEKFYTISIIFIFNYLLIRLFILQDSLQCKSFIVQWGQLIHIVQTNTSPFHTMIRAKCQKKTPSFWRCCSPLLLHTE